MEQIQIDMKSKEIYKENMNYQENELDQIMQEKRSQRISLQASNSMFLKMLAFLIFFAAHGICLYSQPIVHNYSANWKCSNCHQNNWAATHTKDWQGNFYCKKCGHKK